MARLSDEVMAIGRELVAELERESPLYRAISRGTVSREAYVAWLVQQHKYMRWTHEFLVAYANGMIGHTSPRARAIGVGAKQHAKEEVGHADNVVRDLARIWRCSEAEALARVEATPTAPEVHLYEAVARTALARVPAAFAGFSTTMEILAATLSPAARAAMIANAPFDGAAEAVVIFVDHLEDGDHVEGGRVRLDALDDPAERVAAVVIARLARDAYRGLFMHLDATLGTAAIEARGVPCPNGATTPIA